MNKLYYTLLVSTVFNIGIFYGAYKASAPGKSVSVESAIKAARPAPPLSVPAHPITKEIGRAHLPGFVHQFLKLPLTGEVKQQEASKNESAASRSHGCDHWGHPYGGQSGKR